MVNPIDHVYRFWNNFPLSDPAQIVHRCTRGGPSKGPGPPLGESCGGSAAERLELLGLDVGGALSSHFGSDAVDRGPPVRARPPWVGACQRQEVETNGQNRPAALI